MTSFIWHIAYFACIWLSAGMGFNQLFTQFAAMEVDSETAIAPSSTFSVDRSWDFGEHTTP